MKIQENFFDEKQQYCTNVVEVAGSILDEVSFFLVKIGLRGWSRGFDSRRAQKKKYFRTVQPVQLGYVHLLFPTFSVQLICLGYVQSFYLISGAAIF